MDIYGLDGEWWNGESRGKGLNISSGIEINIVPEVPYVIPRLLEIPSAKCVIYSTTIFGNHGLEDDKGIPFYRYQYEMDFDVIIKDIEAEIWENLQYYAAMYIYKRIITELKYPTMVVDNLQKIIAAYP